MDFTGLTLDIGCMCFASHYDCDLLEVHTEFTRFLLLHLTPRLIKLIQVYLCVLGSTAAVDFAASFDEKKMICGQWNHEFTFHKHRVRIEKNPTMLNRLDEIKKQAQTTQPHFKETGNQIRKIKMSKSPESSYCLHWAVLMVNKSMLAWLSVSTREIHFSSRNHKTTPIVCHVFTKLVIERT